MANTIRDLLKEKKGSLYADPEVDIERPHGSEVYTVVLGYKDYVEFSSLIDFRHLLRGLPESIHDIRIRYATEEERRDIGFITMLMVDVVDEEHIGHMEYIDIKTATAVELPLERSNDGARGSSKRKKFSS